MCVRLQLIDNTISTRKLKFGKKIIIHIDKWLHKILKLNLFLSTRKVDFYSFFGYPIVLGIFEELLKILLSWENNFSIWGCPLSVPGKI